MFTKFKIFVLFTHNLHIHFKKTMLILFAYTLNTYTLYKGSALTQRQTNKGQKNFPCYQRCFRHMTAADNLAQLPGVAQPELPAISGEVFIKLYLALHMATEYYIPQSSILGHLFFLCTLSG